MDWHKIFTYSDGNLIWKHDAIDSKGRKTRIRKGMVAGSIRPDGYCGIVVNYERFLKHRIIWEMHNGEIPKGMVIDHIDGNPANSIIENLRLTTMQGNSSNMKMKPCNSSGFNGVSYNNKVKKYHARICVNGEKINLGFYSDINDAIKAREEANINYNFHKNHGEKR